MKTTDINPHIRYAKLHNSNFPALTMPSVCYDCRFFFFHNTPGFFHIGKEKYNITNFTSIFLPPATEYFFDISFEEDSLLTVIDFDLTNECSHITSSLRTATPKTFDETKMPKYEICPEFINPIVKNMPHIERTLMQCMDYFILKSDYYRESSSALLKICLIELIKQETQIAHSELSRNVLQYIRTNYANPTLSNKEIANNFNYHPYYLSKILKEETGKTLRQFLIYYRLRNARDLLSTTDYGISDISQKSGFDSPAHFTKTFRKATGMTPKEYRKKHKFM